MQEALILLLGSIISLIFRFFPVLSAKYEALTRVAKQVVMAIALFVVSAGVFAINCFGIITLPDALVMTCDKGSALELLGIFLVMLVGNQATYPLIEA